MVEGSWIWTWPSSASAGRAKHRTVAAKTNSNRRALGSWNQKADRGGDEPSPRLARHWTLEFTGYFAAPALCASAITASKAGLGWALMSNRSGLPLARQELASLGPQNVTTLIVSCLRKARKSPA